MTVVGNVASDVRYSTTRAGIPVAEFRVAASERRYHRGQQAWVDGVTSFYAVRAYRGAAENVAGSVAKGDPVVLTGWLRVVERRRGDDQSRFYQAEIDALAVGHDLTKGASVFRRTGRRWRAGETTPGSGRGGRADDWAPALGADVPPKQGAGGTDGNDGNDGKAAGRALATWAQTEAVADAGTEDGPLAAATSREGEVSKPGGEDATERVEGRGHLAEEAAADAAAPLPAGAA